MVAKKSAPSHYTPYPPNRANILRRSSSPISLEDKLLYIERWGVNQYEACKECQDADMGVRCFVAAKVSPRCGNCLREGKQCHFLEIIDSSDDEHESQSSNRNEIATEDESQATMRHKDDLRVSSYEQLC